MSMITETLGITGDVHDAAREVASALTFIETGGPWKQGAKELQTAARGLLEALSEQTGEAYYPEEP